jgi:hypothetical protein
MKANKILKRIAKIEALMSKVTERSSGSAPYVQELLRDAKAAVIRAKEAVQASSGATRNPPAKGAKPSAKATPEPSKPKRRLSAAGRKAISEATKKRWAAKRAAAKKATSPVTKMAVAKKVTAKKATPMKAGKAPALKVAKKAPARKVAVKSPAKEGAKAISAALKKRRDAKKAAKPGPTIAKTATAKVAPVKIVKAHVKNVTKNATAKETTLLAPAKEVAEMDRDTNQPPDMESSAETPEQSLPKPSVLGDCTI